MRPVDKGASPYEKINCYQDAEPYLIRHIGRYCSFCEMRVNNALAVEHKESKNSGGALTEWNNLLLSCVYCNSRKNEKVKVNELGKWLWPDQDNTFLCFTYKGALPKINEEYLKGISDDVYQRAKTLFMDLALDYRPGVDLKASRKGKYRDKRWEIRFETLSVAETAKSVWLEYKNTEFREMQLTNIVNQAKGYGFFSIWMMVFESERDVRKALIEAFPGTSQTCFDVEGNPIRRKGGSI